MITGANGQVGRELVNQLILNELYTPVSFFRAGLDVTNELSIHSKIDSSVSLVVNCAAYTAVDLAQTEIQQNWMMNAIAPKQLAKRCHALNIPFIHYSSDYVYDNGTSSPLKETDPCNPKGEYAKAKFAGEQAALYYHDQTIILRTSWVYSKQGNNFVNTIKKLIAEKPELHVVHDQIGSPTYTPDLVNATIQMIDLILNHQDRKDISGIYNYSNKGAISWYDFAKEIASLTHSPCTINPVPTDAFPRPAPRPAYSVMDLTKIQNTFGIQLIDWEKSLQSCLDG